MNIKMMNEIKSQGHPCSGCPYVFTQKMEVHEEM